VGAKLFDVDRQTDMMKKIIIFCNLENPPKINYQYISGNHKNA
jgi:hypothetical protein